MRDCKRNVRTINQKKIWFLSASQKGENCTEKIIETCIWDPKKYGDDNEIHKNLHIGDDVVLFVVAENDVFITAVGEANGHAEKGVVLNMHKFGLPKKIASTFESATIWDTTALSRAQFEVLCQQIYTYE
ncbi:MAG: hypothetical protein ACRCWQ_13820 [Bacilli bacterium]